MISNSYKKLCTIENQLGTIEKILIPHEDLFKKILECLEGSSSSAKPIYSTSSTYVERKEPKAEIEPKVEPSEPLLCNQNQGAICGAFTFQGEYATRDVYVDIQQAGINMALMFRICLPTPISTQVKESSLPAFTHVLTMFACFSGWTLDESLKNESRNILYHGIAPWAASFFPAISPGVLRHFFKILSYLGRKVLLQGEKSGHLYGCFNDGVSGYKLIIHNGQETWIVCSWEVAGLLDQ